jgi:uroporphyrinogen decarboxylase
MGHGVIILGCKLWRNIVTKNERVLNVFKRKEVDYLPSQITLADRTRDDEIHAALGLPADKTLDEYMENHMYISLTKADYPLFFRNDIKLMKELEEEGYCKVDEENKLVYDSWGMGVKIGEDGFFAAFNPLEKKCDIKFAERWMPERIHKAVTADTIEERVKLWTPPDVDQDSNFDWMQRDKDTYGDDYYVFPSGYFGLYERAYGLMSIPEMFLAMAGDPVLFEELLDKITNYKIDVAKRMIAMGFTSGHMGDDLGTQVGPFFSPEMFKKHVKPYYKKLFKVYKDAGCFMMMHSCGCVTEFLPDLIEIGLDVLEPVQPCMGIEFIKKEYGKDLIFWGGIDTQELLPYGSPDEVRKMAAKTIRTLGAGGGHIIGPAQEIMKDVPLDNVIALVETIINERESAATL